MLRKMFSLGALVVVAVTFGVANASAAPKKPASPAARPQPRRLDGRFLGRSRLATVRPFIRAGSAAGAIGFGRAPDVKRAGHEQDRGEAEDALTTMSVTRMPTLKLSATLFVVTFRNM